MRTRQDLLSFIFAIAALLAFSTCPPPPTLQIVAADRVAALRVCDIVASRESSCTHIFARRVGVLVAGYCVVLLSRLVALFVLP